MKFSNKEIKDLLFAGFMISLAFAVLFAGSYKILLNFDFILILSFILAFFTAGLGFLLHEIMHKFVARKYGLWAEFRAFHSMLWLALLFSFFGFIFAAPGAVFIRGRIDKEKNGKISLAGPMTNIVLGILFLILFILFEKNGLLKLFFENGLTINALLGAFNMIPAMPFDGAKVFVWNKSIYWITTLIAVVLFGISLFI